MLVCLCHCILVCLQGVGDVCMNVQWNWDVKRSNLKRSIKPHFKSVQLYLYVHALGKYDTHALIVLQTSRLKPVCHSSPLGSSQFTKINPSVPRQIGAWYSPMTLKGCTAIHCTLGDATVDWFKTHREFIDHLGREYQHCTALRTLGAHPVKCQNFVADTEDN